MALDNAGRHESLEDAKWVEQVKAGEAYAFNRLIRRYQDRVFNTCWRLCGQRDDAQDLTQEAFLRAFRNIYTFRGESTFYTWLFRIAVNQVLSHRRSAARHSTISLDQAGFRDHSQASELMRRVRQETTEDPKEHASRLEQQRLLVGALQSLDEEHRTVVVLRDVEGLDYRQIGFILDVPVGTVKSRLYRARSALRETISPTLRRE